MTNSVLAQIGALKSLPSIGLKARWRELFDTEPPPYNRRFLESRLAYASKNWPLAGSSLRRLSAWPPWPRDSMERAPGAPARPRTGQLRAPG